MSRGTEHEDIVTAAQEEARRMIDSVAEGPPDGEVTMKIAQFRKLAQLIDGLAGAASRDGRFDAPIDGVRFWVPAQHLAAERARFAQMLAQRPAAHAVDRFAF